ncbi:hypothetical protein [Streptomyces hygroscopicus]|uniref:hypothetical protein n=1 Tax=Streptomyces hygroscopicus TaxID=1912 RepID=UPI000826D1AA
MRRPPLEGGVGEPVEIKVEVLCEGEALLEASDQDGAVVSWVLAPLRFQSAEGALGRAPPVLV